VSISMAEPKEKGASGLCTRPCEKTIEPRDYVVLPKGKAHEAYAKTPRVSVLNVVRSLESLPDDEFTSDSIADFLRRHPIDLESIGRYTLFDSARYTRNRIALNHRFEVMLLCWEQGHATPVHNHDGQSCWVYLLSGKLSFTNYKWLGCDRGERTVHLKELSRVPMAAEGSMNVIDERDAIHQLANEPAFGTRAISLHVYAKPLQTCVVYDAKAGNCWDQRLAYYSIDGVRVPALPQIIG